MHKSAAQLLNCCDEVKHSEAVHVNITCDACCITPIIGDRYKCTICDNFDLCSSCEALSCHSHDHPMLKIKIPRSTIAEASAVCKGFRSRHAHRSTSRPHRSFAKFVEDVSIPDRSILAPGEVKEKIWKIQNNGKYSWPPGFKVVILSGESVVDPDYRQIVLPEVKPGEIISVAVRILVPSKAGRYVSYFRLINLDGEKFGPRFWLDFYVPEVSCPPPVASPPSPDKSVETPKCDDKKQHYSTQLRELELMGFRDDGLNIFLLDKFEGKTMRVVNWLLDRSRTV